MEEITLKSPTEIEKMRAAGRLVARIHLKLEEAIAPGVTTGELDILAGRIIEEAGARSAFRGYTPAGGNVPPYPAVICASVNEEVVHGIPGARRLKKGEIISIDVGVELNGYFGDMAKTYPVGAVSRTRAQLLRVTREALEKAIEKSRVGNRLSDIAEAVEGLVVKNGLSVVREYVGHGIGTRMHEPPQIPNFWRAGSGPNPRLRPGMVLAIEPMVNQGTWRTKRLGDQWTVVTKDGKCSAHFEHTVAVTANGPDVLTRLEPGR